MFLVPIDFHSIFFSSILLTSMATSNYLIMNILQNVFFYVKQKKEDHKCVDQLKGE